MHPGDRECGRDELCEGPVRNARVVDVRQTLVRLLARWQGRSASPWWRGGRRKAMVCSICASSSPASPASPGSPSCIIAETAPQESARRSHPGQHQELRGSPQGEGGGPEPGGCEAAQHAQHCMQPELPGLPDCSDCTALALAWRDGWLRLSGIRQDQESDTRCAGRRTRRCGGRMHKNAERTGCSRPGQTAGPQG